MKQTSNSLCSRLEVILIWIKENAIKNVIQGYWRILGANSTPVNAC